MLEKKDGTIKTYTDRTRNEKKELVFSFDERAQNAQPASTFNHMPYILAKKQVPEGEIFLIDGDIKAFQSLIQLIKETETEDIKIGVIFRVNGHATPFVIEKIFDEKTEKDNVCVYNTDAVVMDIDAVDDIKALINVIAQDTPIYSLGIRDPQGNILRDYKRQFDTSSCATYSLYDIEQILRMDFHSFALEHSEQISENLYNLQALPPALMASIQSVNGKKEAGIQLRNGLEYCVSANPNDASKEIVVNGEVTTLKKLLEEIQQEHISNPIIDIMNYNNLNLYSQGLSQYNDKYVNKYTLTSEKMAQQKTKYQNLIFDIAARQYDTQAEPLVNAAPERESKSNQNATSNSSGVVATIAIATAIAGIIVLLLEMQNEGQREIPALRRRVTKPQPVNSKENVLEAIKARAQQLRNASYRRATPKDFGIVQKVESTTERELRKRDIANRNTIARSGAHL